MRSQRDYPSLLPTGDPITFERAKGEALAALDELLDAEREPQNAADHLILASASLAKKDFLSAAKSYATALEDEAIRSDMNYGHLYNGACVAAMAAAGLADEEAARWRRQALSWLADDLRRRAAMLESIEKELAGSPEPKRRARLERARELNLGQIEHARVKDPDLASLRGTPEFDALFEKSGG